MLGPLMPRVPELVDDCADVDVVGGVEDAEVRATVGLELVVGHVGDVALPLARLYAADLHAVGRAVEVGPLLLDPELVLELGAAHVLLVVPLLLPVLDWLGARVGARRRSRRSRCPSGASSSGR